MLVSVNDDSFSTVSHIESTVMASMLDLKNSPFLAVLLFSLLINLFPIRKGGSAIGICYCFVLNGCTMMQKVIGTL